MLRLIRHKYSFHDFVEMERYLIVQCLAWKMNITTPYHFSDSIQGMGCLFWTDFDPFIAASFNPHGDTPEAEKSARAVQEKMVLFLIQYRKYINYFVEQSLINGLWGHFPQDVIALASTFIARFEMINIQKIRWRRKKITDPLIPKIQATWNDSFIIFMDASP